MCPNDLAECPLCAGEIDRAAVWCIHCGRNIPPLTPRPQNLYVIVADGAEYGIKLGDEMKIGGLDLNNAMIVAAALNCK